MVSSPAIRWEQRITQPVLLSLSRNRGSGGRKKKRLFRFPLFRFPANDLRSPALTASTSLSRTPVPGSAHLEHQLAAQVTPLAHLMRRGGLRQRVLSRVD